jgi:hypothetical protein
MSDRNCRGFYKAMKLSLNHKHIARITSIFWLGRPNAIKVADRLYALMTDRERQQVLRAIAKLPHLGQRPTRYSLHLAPCHVANRDCAFCIADVIDQVSKQVIHRQLEPVQKRETLFHVERFSENS